MNLIAAIASFVLISWNSETLLPIDETYQAFSSFPWKDGELHKLGIDGKLNADVSINGVLICHGTRGVGCFSPIGCCDRVEIHVGAAGGMVGPAAVQLELQHGICCLDGCAPPKCGPPIS
jgi:hypothetical protein